MIRLASIACVFALALSGCLTVAQSPVEPGPRAVVVIMPEESFWGSDAHYRVTRCEPSVALEVDNASNHSIWAMVESAEIDCGLAEPSYFFDGKQVWPWKGGIKGM